MINLLAYGADPTGVSNSGPALQSAINALGTANGTLLVVPPGTYLLTAGTVRNFIGAGNATAITIRGEGSATIFKIAVGAGTRALQLQNLESVLLDDLTFVSSTTNGTAIDARNTLSLEYCRKAIIRNCGFYGLTTVRGGPVGAPAGAVVYAHQTDLRIENCAFRGCAGDYTIGMTPFDGTPVVDCDSWTGLSVTDTEFIDWGFLNGTYVGATGIPSSAWIRVGKPAPRVGQYRQAAAGQARIVLRNVRLDEGAFYGIAIKSPVGCEPASHVSLSGLMVNGFNVGAPGSGSGIYIDRADHVLIEQSWFGWTAAGAPRAAITLVNAKNVTVDGVFCDLNGGMTKIVTAGDTDLVIRGSVFS